ncbi:hypothetical protein UR09_01185 [Candidatus Nitromaritima sp. SCGC AAA799-A02]|nr:hypothetical protein UZ36_04130 [Candidatus Nitromaritima sp. SCGC AAA799-C22]KMP12378.1 hypothetical protein UR09_01185 [Candidatus Nitromaritima sp. SCGC AAA799-A02]
MTGLDTQRLDARENSLENETSARLCDHQSSTETIDYDEGIEYCCYCGALGLYDIDKDALDWTFPQYLSGGKKN